MLLHRSETEEGKRLAEDEFRKKNWKRWGPYLSERQWGTVREDYSEGGSCWEHFSHDQSRSRVYRWGEDGLLGITDRECRMCFSLALWNGRDPILKERLYGLTGPEGNHGEDVKENYYYLDSTPTHSYLKALYKYPQGPFPYRDLIETNSSRGKREAEYELEDTGAFEGDRYFDVTAEYAKAGPNDILVRFTVENRGPEKATLHLLPTLWYRNTWSWGRDGEGYWKKPKLERAGQASIVGEHESLGRYRLEADAVSGAAPTLLFTENESNNARLWKSQNTSPYVKDGFHAYVVHGNSEALNPEGMGTKAAAHYRLEVPAKGKVVVRLRLSSEDEAPKKPFGNDFDETFAKRISEADQWYSTLIPQSQSPAARAVSRQAYAGLLWSKQYYHYAVRHWLEGDPSQPKPPEAREEGRNAEWKHLYNRDVISMPDKWEYPWYAAWDLAFHMVPFSRMDPHFAKQQLILFLREWYMHPNGQLPAYEFAFGDVNPPVHAWACWRVYKRTGIRGKRDRVFLARAFQKLLLNFTWWVNRKDIEGNNLFSGGFLGLDNIGVFDRSKPLPTGGYLEQADGTAWMAFYCTTMLSMALELAREDHAYEDIASKFFEHFIHIVDAINNLGGTGLWDEEDGFYYDQLHVNGRNVPLRIRSMVGLIPLFAAELLENEALDKLPGFASRMKWFLANRPDLVSSTSYLRPSTETHGHRLLAIPSKERLLRVLKYVLDENEFLSPYGIRSLSRVHKDDPFVFRVGQEEYRVDYDPAESSTGMFGGNSNWRGPIWFPLNYLLIEALERYHHFYGDELKVECPTGSGQFRNLGEVANELASRLSRIFLPDAKGVRPVHGANARYANDPNWKELVLFYEYFHGDTGRGVGASHQTGWTALAIECIDDMFRGRLR